MSDSIAAGGHSALTDEQTGLPNRLHFETVLEPVFATGQRGMPLSVVLLEIDGGGEWLQKADPAAIARVFRNIRKTLVPVVRQTDVLARVGECRFAVCLLDWNMAGGVLVADRIDGLKDSLGPATGLGFSIGGAAFDRDMDRPTDLLGAAEQALRVAQNRGANQTEFHQ